jgi:hypothetical protein
MDQATFLLAIESYLVVVGLLILSIVCGIIAVIRENRWNKKNDKLWDSIIEDALKEYDKAISKK